MKIAIAFATLLLTATLAGQGTHVFPFAPTTATPVEVHYLSSCTARTHEVVREGHEITIVAHDRQCPNVLPIPLVEKVKLPEALPAGVYDVSILQEFQPFFLTGTRFVVRNGGPKPFELHPATVYPHGGDPVHVSGIACEEADCSDVTLRIDGQPVTIEAADGGTFRFTAPDHESGLVDVTVQKQGSAVTSPGALYYRHSHQGRDLSAEEPILLPVVHSVDGAFGSRWESEVTVSNPRPWAVDADYTLHNIGPCISDCDPPFEPKSFQKFSNGYPRGTVMWVPRSEAAELALSLRTRDVSRQQQGWGTEVPVVREQDFIHGRNIRLLDVPLDPRYRVKVRVYMIEPLLTVLRSGAVRFRRGDDLLSIPFTFTAATNGLRIEPFYAEVDLPQGVIGERLPVEIVLPLDATGWAFASITNNETQQVTIVAPN
ncbi:MAG TPA: IPT/TIG domain-containing protein [Thermoanaerobaculia bacterium]